MYVKNDPGAETQLRPPISPESLPHPSSNPLPTLVPEPAASVVGRRYIGTDHRRKVELMAVKVRLPSRPCSPRWGRQIPTSSCATYERLTKRTINPVPAHLAAISPSSTGSLEIWTSVSGSTPMAWRFFGYLGRLNAASPMLHHVLWTLPREPTREFSIQYSTFSVPPHLGRLQLRLPLSAPLFANLSVVRQRSRRKSPLLSCALSLMQFFGSHILTRRSPVSAQMTRPRWW